MTATSVFLELFPVNQLKPTIKSSEPQYKHKYQVHHDVVNPGPFDESPPNYKSGALGPILQSHSRALTLLL